MSHPDDAPDKTVIKTDAGYCWFDTSIYGGREFTGIDAIQWAQKCQDLGAGEILLTSMDGDGTQNGYDIELNKTINDAVDIPVIASGGVGEPKHILEVFEKLTSQQLLRPVFSILTNIQFLLLRNI